MNLLLISDDEVLKRAFEELDYFTLTNDNNLNDENESDNTIIVISDKKIRYNDLICTIDNNELNPKIDNQFFYILSNDYSDSILNNIQIMCKSRDIKTFLPGTEASVIANNILLSVKPEFKSKKSNIITFFGADSKVGTTMITQSVAEVLAKITDVKIGLFFLNEKPSNFYIKEDNVTSIDDIKMKLFNNILYPEEIVSTCIKEDNELYVLPGVNYVSEMRQYHPEHIRKLINLATEKFDLIIIDAGSNIDSGLAIASLTSTNIKYLITTQQENMRKNYQRIESQIFKKLNINEKEFMLIINKYIKSSHMYTAKQIGNLYDLIIAGQVPYMDLLGWQAETENRTLLNYDNEVYNDQIYKIAKLILEQVNIPYKVEKQRKEGILRKAMSNIGG